MDILLVLRISVLFAGPAIIFLKLITPVGRRVFPAWYFRFLAP